MFSVVLEIKSLTKPFASGASGSILGIGFSPSAVPGKFIHVERIYNVLNEPEMANQKKSVENLLSGTKGTKFP